LLYRPCRGAQPIFGDGWCAPAISGPGNMNNDL
jgi:hypothetical protein